jgi:peptidoglycan/xylan/chitin deacetylase (PgdA/CDA1 family)
LRTVLTVVQFHRVLDPADSDFADADPTYTVTPAMFEGLLGFFRQHYSVVALADVLDASRKMRRLPDFPLLISFDDGWRDNLVYAAPLLRRHQMPAVVFAAVEAVASPSRSWWHEQVLCAWRTGTLADALACGRSDQGGDRLAGLDASDGPLDLICKVAALTELDRTRLLARLAGAGRSQRMMMSPGDLKSLASFGISVGVHGLTHLPLTKVTDLALELASAREWIAQITGDEIGARSLAFPHGRYDANVVAAAHSCGYALTFSSDPMLNPMAGGYLDAARPLARIEMIEASLGDASRRPASAAMATWLWHRPMRPA